MGQCGNWGWGSEGEAYLEVVGKKKRFKTALRFSKNSVVFNSLVQDRKYKKIKIRKSRVFKMYSMFRKEGNLLALLI